MGDIKYTLTVYFFDESLNFLNISTSKEKEWVGIYFGFKFIGGELIVGGTAELRPYEDVYGPYGFLGKYMGKKRKCFIYFRNELQYLLDKMFTFSKIESVNGISNRFNKHHISFITRDIQTFREWVLTVLLVAYNSENVSVTLNEIDNFIAKLV